MTFAHDNYSFIFTIFINQGFHYFKLTKTHENYGKNDFKLQ